MGGSLCGQSAGVSGSETFAVHGNHLALDIQGIVGLVDVIGFYEGQGIGL